MKIVLLLTACMMSASLYAQHAVETQVEYSRAVDGIKNRGYGVLTSPTMLDSASSDTSFRVAEEDSPTPILAERNVKQIVNLFSKFNATYSYITGGSNSSSAFELSTTTVDLWIPLARVPKQQTSGGVTKSSYNTLDIQVINRASINVDSLRAIANDYITSFNGAPLTLRIKKEFSLSNNTDPNLPSFAGGIGIDGRVIPYTTNEGLVTAGVSSQTSLVLGFSAAAFEESANIPNRLYLDLVTMLNVSDGNVAKSLYSVNDASIFSFTFELRGGILVSEGSKLKDGGFIIRYVSGPNILGPRWRVGLSFSPK